MLSELVQHVGLLHVATHAVRNRSLPRALEKIAVRHIIEAIDVLGNEWASLAGILLKHRQLGVTLADALHHHKRSVIVGEIHADPIVVDLLVHPTNEIGEGHVLLQSVNSFGGIHLV